ncbi:hypothetical protein E4U09_003193 [Claviceps aff. purpurea]|uniref:Uncharacterized protein n=1 Tax=Claviceps aff. purpurea TaxID=1967640 RepID=A0A9P7QM30_9HYPO|nr:hypothetical protein E4U09_003193 [Claviceps aff. purpurea]
MQTSKDNNEINVIAVASQHAVNCWRKDAHSFSLRSYTQYQSLGSHIARAFVFHSAFVALLGRSILHITNILVVPLNHTGTAMSNALKQTGCIINNVSNLIAVKADLGVTACTVSKAGVVAFSRALCLEMAARSVRVNALLSGRVESSMWNMGWSRKKKADVEGKYWKTPSLIDLFPLLDLKPELKEAYLGDLGGMPSNRVARPVEVADAAVFLATNGYANNCVLNLDGGLSAA